MARKDISVELSQPFVARVGDDGERPPGVLLERLQDHQVLVLVSN